MLVKIFIDGFKEGWERGKERYNLNLAPPNEPNEAILEEIALLEIVIERRKQAALILEYELTHTRNQNKRITIINKLNTMDKQTFKDIQRLNKLKDMV